ncbi:MAG TPA: hypothetical protein DCL76_05850 [Chloroflexi bacterium]|nr:hypothetical protein [Chloroflexota bacterium]HCU99418.1 hypothetical protein [Chloroflexota bacterium]|tara:strand:- start:1008 stop:1442 length:435 start_codon:yes stop_codon:yes gene_type:complete
MENKSITPTVSNLFLKTSHGSPMEPVQSVSAITGEGLLNDVSRGRKLRQVLIIDNDTLTDFGLSPGILRENITIDGMSISTVEPGTILHLGNVQLEVALNCAPCDLLDEIRPGLQDEMTGKRGMLCRVREGGTIKIGDQIELEK